MKRLTLIHIDFDTIVYEHATAFSAFDGGAGRKTQGHADYEAFKMLFDITKPDIAIPIHTEDKYKIKEFTPNVFMRK